MSLSVLFALQILWVNVHVALSQNPLIVQHGISGSIIEVQGENAELPLLCPRTFSRRRLWLDIEQAFILRCFKAAIRLNGVDAEGNGRFPTGLSGGVPSDGIFATSCIDPSDAISCSLTRYLRDFYDFLVSRGYVLGRTLDAVPYDWRFSPIDFKQQGNYFSRLKERVEIMFDETGKKVTILGHSMGSATTTLFLNSYVTQEWKDKYVRMFISVVGAIGGSVSGLKRGLIGQREAIFSASTVAEIISTFPGVHSLVPANAPDSMVYGSEPLFVLGNESFNVNNLPDLYRRFGLNDFADVLNELRGQYQVPPGVRTHCIFGRGFDTVTKVTIPDPNDLDDFTEEFEDGDETLTLESQKVCANFASRQSQPVTTETFTASHTAIIRDRSSVWDHILDMINDDPLTSHHIFLEIASASCLLANVLMPLLLLSYSLY